MPDLERLIADEAAEWSSLLEVLPSGVGGAERARAFAAAPAGAVSKKLGAPRRKELDGLARPWSAAAWAALLASEVGRLRGRAGEEPERAISEALARAAAEGTLFDLPRRSPVWRWFPDEAQRETAEHVTRRLADALARSWSVAGWRGWLESARKGKDADRAAAEARGLVAGAAMVMLLDLQRDPAWRRFVEALQASLGDDSPAPVGSAGAVAAFAHAELQVRFRRLLGGSATGKPQEIDDCTSHVIGVVLRKLLTSFEVRHPIGPSFTSWLKLVGGGAAKDWWRRRALEGWTEIVEGDPGTFVRDLAHLLAGGEELGRGAREAVREWMSECSPRDRMIFKLRHGLEAVPGLEPDAGEVAAFPGPGRTGTTLVEAVAALRDLYRLLSAEELQAACTRAGCSLAALAAAVGGARAPDGGPPAEALALAVRSLGPAATQLARRLADGAPEPGPLAAVRAALCGCPGASLTAKAAREHLDDAATSLEATPKAMLAALAGSALKEEAEEAEALAARVAGGLGPEGRARAAVSLGVRPEELGALALRARWRALEEVPASLLADLLAMSRAAFDQAVARVSRVIFDDVALPSIRRARPLERLLFKYAERLERRLGVEPAELAALGPLVAPRPAADVHESVLADKSKSPVRESAKLAPMLGGVVTAAAIDAAASRVWRDIRCSLRELLR